MDGTLIVSFLFIFLPNNISNWPIRSLYYALPYLVLGLLVFFVGYREIWGRKRIGPKRLVFIFITFLFFFGLRWHIMSDTLAYEEEYYSFTTNFNWKYINDHSWWWDKGFVVFAMFCKIISPNFFFFVFVNTLVDITLFSLCLKKYKVNISILILSFLAFQGILQEINTMRNIKAILLFVYSISYIYDRRILKYLTINFIGFFFHSSALLYFPMYWILNRKYSIKVLLPALVIITIIYLANNNFLQDYLISFVFSGESYVSEKVINYLGSSEEQTISLGFIERLLTLTLCLLVYNKQKRNTFNLIVINSFFVFYFLYAIFGFNFVFRDRIPYLFIFAYWFLYPYLFDNYGRRGAIYKFAFLALLFGKIYLSTRICSAYYETVLFHETTRTQRQYLNDRLQN